MTCSNRKSPALVGIEQAIARISDSASVRPIPYDAPGRFALGMYWYGKQAGGKSSQRQGSDVHGWELAEHSQKLGKDHAWLPSDQSVCFGVR